MAQIRVVKAGEHLAQIASEYGVPKEKIWLDLENKDLRDRRKTPDMLHPGDRLVIPERERRTEQAPTGARTRFRRKGGYINIKLQLRDEFGDPVQNVGFRLHLSEGGEVTGHTDGDGYLQAKLPAATTSATLVLEELHIVRDLDIGALNQTSRKSGVRQRLANLDFYKGAIDEDLGPKTRAALLRFQMSRGLEPTGVADKATRDELDNQHGRSPLNVEAEDDMGKEQKITLNETGPLEPSGVDDPPPTPAQAGAVDLSLGEGD